VVAIFADHGEHLGEHGRSGHGMTLDDALVRVPLVLRAPGLEGGVEDAPVSLVDLFPTILELCGVAGVKARAGLSLVGPVPRGRLLLSESRASTGGPAYVALRQDEACLHCDELAQLCTRCDLAAHPLASLATPGSGAQAALGASLGLLLDHYRNDRRQAARREAFFERWGRR
jgi:hypothetical protein